ncbi:hypothetical protein [Aliterella atlantica]|uniref:Cytochrome P450 n=1 Tax=Aliterella atlantica CENA595 TaxID=1618023 RepID=A0A0D8ZY21_9CYAN|nr:hypothetical protein [Aliterella atlantica]KJH73282.1 hypothetical protein UH38_00295 [Aliterella atlantica CENA595]
MEAIARPTQRLEEYAKQYGDIFISKSSGLRPFVLFSHSQAIQQILTADPNLFDFDIENQMIHPLVGDYSLGSCALIRNSRIKEVRRKY